MIDRYNNFILGANKTGIRFYNNGLLCHYCGIYKPLSELDSAESINHHITTFHDNNICKNDTNLSDLKKRLLTPNYYFKSYSEFLEASKDPSNIFFLEYSTYVECVIQFITTGVWNFKRDVTRLDLLSAIDFLRYFPDFKYLLSLMFLQKIKLYPSLTQIKWMYKDRKIAKLNTDICFLWSVEMVEEFLENHVNKHKQPPYIKND